MRALSAANSLVQVTGTNLNLVYLVLGVSLVALAIAWALRSQVLAASDGTPKMQEIAAAVQEGAAAYPHANSRLSLTLLSSFSYFSSHFLEIWM